MPRRQQRASRDRRNIDRAQPALVPLLAPYTAIPYPGGVEITLAIPDVPGTLEGQPGDFFLTGLPRWYAIGADEFATAAVAAGASGSMKLRLTFPSGELPLDETLFNIAYDGACRTEQGGYVAPGKVLVTLG